MALDIVNKDFKMWLWILISVSVITKACGYSSGNFPQSCESMSPEHTGGDGPHPPQDTELPFEMLLEPGQEDDPITVLLRSKGSTEFRGFMLEARDADGGHHVGKFIALEPESTQLLRCNNTPDTAVSQSNNQRKTSFRANWTAMGADVDITFRVTFLQRFAVFWEPVNVHLTRRTTTSPTSTSTSPLPGTTERSMTTSQKPDVFNVLEGAGTAMMNADSLLLAVKTELPNIFMTVLPASPSSLHLKQVSKMACRLLCAAVEISAMLLFSFADPVNVTLVALVCMALVINVLELVITCLPIERHELKEIFDYAGKVCSVVHQMFTIAVVFVGVSDIDNCGKNGKGSWLLNVMIVYTVWIVLCVIWVIVISVLRKKILARSKEGGSQRKKKRPSAAEAVVLAVSGILTVGNLCFAVAVTVGIFVCQDKKA